MVSKLRRLIADHADLHNSDLPPNYIFPAADASLTDDLTQLVVCLTGPQGTPYSAGLWRLHLKIPEDYPQSPPKAAFRTRIWHPNVEETSGAVCVDTLKRDWESKLTLRDILVTISCLLIQPNPDSALNSSAGALLQDDYDEFARQARLMTSIHAPIPQGMIEAVLEAKRRGEDPGTTVRLDEDPQIQTVKGATRTTSLVMKKKQAAPTAQESEQTTDSREEAVQSDADMEAEDPKENDPSLSPSPVTIPPPPSPRKNVLGKRPLSVLATRLPDADVVMGDDSDSDEHTFDGMTASERNVAANKSANSSFTQGFSSSSSTSSTDNLFQKSSSPKSFTFGDSDTTMAPPSSSYAIYEDGQDSIAHLHTRCISHGKENLTTTAGFLQTRKEPSAGGGSGVVVQKNHPSSIPLGVSSVATHHNVVAAAAGKPLAPGKITKPTVSGGIGGRKTSYSVARGKPRVGVRRL